MSLLMGRMISGLTTCLHSSVLEKTRAAGLGEDESTLIVSHPSVDPVAPWRPSLKQPRGVANPTQEVTRKPSRGLLKVSGSEPHARTENVQDPHMALGLMCQHHAPRLLVTVAFDNLTDSWCNVGLIGQWLRRKFPQCRRRRR